MEDRRVILSNLFLNLVKFACELGQIITRYDTLEVGRVILSNVQSNQLYLI